MQQRKRAKIVHEGRHLAVVDVTIVGNDADWAPYLSLEQAYRLDDVHEALQSGETSNRLLATDGCTNFT